MVFFLCLCMHVLLECMGRTEEHSIHITDIVLGGFVKNFIVHFFELILKCMLSSDWGHNNRVLFHVSMLLNEIRVNNNFSPCWWRYIIIYNGMPEGSFWFWCSWIYRSVLLLCNWRRVALNSWLCSVFFRFTWICYLELKSYSIPTS